MECVTVNQLAGEDGSDAVWRANAESIVDACAGIALGLYECPRPYLEAFRNVFGPAR